jgi:hypothetical protein
MDHRPPAPGGLALVEAFLRTRNSVTSPPALARWLRAHGFRCGPLDASELAAAFDVREAIRTLAAANSAPPPAPAAVQGAAPPSGPAAMEGAVPPSGPAVEGAVPPGPAVLKGAMPVAAMDAMRAAVMGAVSPAVGVLDALLVEHRVTPALSGDPASPVLRWRAAGVAPGDGLPAALAVILGGVVTAIADGTWPRFKTCAADDCRYAFYDHTRNRSTRWCDVAGCGVNTRMRAYRTRRTTP